MAYPDKTVEKIRRENVRLKKNIRGLGNKVDRLNREQAGLVECRDFFNVLMKNIPDTIYFKDLNSRFTLINQAMTKILRIKDPSDALGKTDFDFFSSEHAQQAFNDEQTVINTGEPIVNKEEMETWEDGRIRWVSTTKFPLKNHRGKITGTFGLSRDINRLKLAEATLKKWNEELEKRIQQRTESLRKANVGMKNRIQQLDYLNRKAQFFTQLIDRDSLLPAIFYAFKERFPGGEVHLCEVTPEGFRTAYSSEGFKKYDLLPACIKALRYFRAEEGEDLFIEPCWTKNVLFKGLFNTQMRRLPCYIIIPLITNKKMRGMVQVFAPAGFNKVYKQEVTLLNTLAAQAAISLDNANNYLELEEETRLKSELEIARGIQQRFTPQDPVIPKFRIKGDYRPARKVGGDYLDFFKNESGDWVCVIADVCGKGVPAALVMSSLRSTIRAEGRKQDSPKKLLIAVNDLVGAELLAENSFITCMILIIEKDGGRMKFSRAGHQMLIAYNEKSEPRNIPCMGVALGLVLGPEFESMLEEVSLNLASGDKFFAYTDGLDEAIDPAREIYGKRRLMELVDTSRSLAPGKLIEAVLKDLDLFCQGQSLNDDLTMFAIEKE